MSTIPEGGPTENCILLAILPSRSYKAYLHTQILWTLTYQTQKQAYKRIVQTTQIDAEWTYIRTIDPTQYPAWPSLWLMMRTVTTVQGSQSQAIPDPELLTRLIIDLSCKHYWLFSQANDIFRQTDPDKGGDTNLGFQFWGWLLLHYSKDVPTDPSELHCTKIARIAKAMSNVTLWPSI